MGCYYKRFAARIGIVCDAILYESLSSAADFVYMPPADDFQERIAAIDVLLVVSTWSGLHDGEWDGLGRIGEPIRRRLLEMIDACNRKGIPTVFYSKEDPPNYTVFLDFAKACRHVFTSAAEMVPRYKEDCGHERVGVLKFCINPTHDNPIGCSEKEQILGAIFSGSWMVMFPLRCRDLAALLDGVLESGQRLCIVNRNSRYGCHPGYRFPRRFRKSVIPAMPHAQLSALHRKYRWSINVNSVTDSSTMFAGRCYELLANGCLVLSNFSPGMLNELPEIAIADSAGFAAGLMKGITDCEIDILRSSGIRRVMSGNTCYDRVAEILKAVGFPVEIEHPTVAVVIPEDDAGLAEMFKAQSYAKKKLYVADAFDDQAKSDCRYVTYWEVGQTYGPYYIQDLLDAFKYADVDFAVDEGSPYSYVDRPVPGRTLFEVGSESRKGFCIKRSDATAEDVRGVCDRIHEIVVSPGRRAEDYKPPLLVRALACLYDNGFLYTLKRIFWGRQY